MEHYGVKQGLNWIYSKKSFDLKNSNCRLTKSISFHFHSICSFFHVKQNLETGQEKMPKCSFFSNIVGHVSVACKNRPEQVSNALRCHVCRQGDSIKSKSGIRSNTNALMDQRSIHSRSFTRCQTRRPLHRTGAHRCL